MQNGKCNTQVEVGRLGILILEAFKFQATKALSYIPYDILS